MFYGETRIKMMHFSDIILLFKHSSQQQLILTATYLEQILSSTWFAQDCLPKYLGKIKVNILLESEILNIFSYVIKASLKDNILVACLQTVLYLSRRYFIYLLNVIF